MTEIRAMKRIFLAFTIFYLISCLIYSTAHAESKCQTDYQIPQKRTPNQLRPDQVLALQYFSNSNNPKEGWKLLGENGDDYAAIAYQVLANEPGVGQWYYQLIHKHWKNTTGEAQTEINFWPVAVQHFKQYVEIIKTGILPDSDQILQSYLKAIKDHHLPELTVFDAAWILSDSQQIQTWQNLNHLSEERTVHESRVCLHSEKNQAREIIRKDMSPF